MATYPKIKIKHSPVVTYPSLAQGNYVGAQTISGRRGSLPTFNDSNSYSVAKTGSDANSGTAAAPFLTLGKAFLPSATGLLTDYSGNAYTLTQNGTVPQNGWPCWPLPIVGDYNCGPFDDTNNFTIPAGLSTALSSDTFTIEGWVLFTSFNAANTIFSNTTGTAVECYCDNTGIVSFNIGGTALSSPAGTITAGKHYYVAFSYSYGTANGKKIYVGLTPETVTAVATATQSTHITGLSGGKIGRAIAANAYCNAYFSRLFFSNVARSSFPTNLYSSGTTVTSGVIAAYYFQTLPLMVTAPLSYVVVNDSGTYNEAFRFNFKYENASSIGIYAKDGYVPTFKLTAGAVAGTYGAGNASRAVLTNSPSTTCYVAKTGHDSGGSAGARGNPALPFKTIAAALAATTTTGDTVEIQDSGTYVEDLIQPARALTIQSSLGQAPILKAVSTTATAKHITASSAVSLSLSGLILSGPGVSYQTLLYKETALTTLTIADCTMLNYYSIYGANVTIAATNSIFDMAKTGTTGTLTASGSYTNCQFKRNITFLNQSPLVTLSGCTFISGFVNDGAGGDLKVYACLFDGPVTDALPNQAVVSGGNNTGFAYCVFKNSGSHNVTVLYLAGGKTLVYGCTFSGTIGTGVECYSNSTCAWIYHCSAMNLTRGFYLEGTLTNCRIYYCSTLNCTTAGVDSVSGGVVGVGLVDSGSALGYTGGIAPTFSGTATYVSTVSGNENVAQLSASVGTFLVRDGQVCLDAGIGAPLFDITAGSVTLNGLTISGNINQLAGVTSTSEQAFTVSFCTFSGLGPFGVRLTATATASNCLFSVNGTAIKTGLYGSSITNCVGYSCASAFIQNFGQTLTVSLNSSSGCDYGYYEDVSATATVSSCIFSSSASFDYSAATTPTYSCVGTLDTGRPINSSANLGTGCIRQDPIYADANNGDLTLQAIARGYYWDSPCISTGSAGADMGAFAFTYGSASTSWTTVDFASTSSGFNYRNPDQVIRKNLPIKLAEGDREDGSIYSVSAAYRAEYELIWSSNSNDMPQAQLADLLVMFQAQSNVIQVDWGAGYVDAYFARQQGFEYSDMTGGYSDSSQPRPLRSLIIREA